MRAMECSDMPVLLETYPRASAFNDSAANSDKQCFDAPPFQRCRNRIGKHGCKRLAVRSVHMYMVPVNGSMSTGPENSSRLPVQGDHVRTGLELDRTTSDMLLVPGGGIEPPWCHHRGILSPVRLPIPPSRPCARNRARGRRIML